MKNDLGKRMDDGSRTRRRELRRLRRCKRHAGRSLSDADQPRLESTRTALGRLKREKDPSLRPLERFLDARVGRQWDDVFSEICRDSHWGAFHRHRLRYYVDMLVEQGIMLVDGVPYRSDGMALSPSWDRFWVHPVSGVLIKNERRQRPRIRRSEEPKPVVLGADRRAVQIEGIWYEITLEPIPPYPPTLPREYRLGATGNDPRRVAFDCVLNLPVIRCPVEYLGNISRFERHWGGEVYAACKRQMNKREIRRLRKVVAERGVDRL